MHSSCIARKMCAFIKNWIHIFITSNFQKTTDDLDFKLSRKYDFDRSFTFKAFKFFFYHYFVEWFNLTLLVIDVIFH